MRAAPLSAGDPRYVAAAMASIPRTAHHDCAQYMRGLDWS